MHVMVMNSNYESGDFCLKKQHNAYTSPKIKNYTLGLDIVGINEVIMMHIAQRSNSSNTTDENITMHALLKTI